MSRPKKQIPSHSRQMCLDHIKTEYRRHCDLNDIEPTDENLLQYLAEREIITHRTFIWYFVIHLFWLFYERNNSVKQLAYWDMENYLPIGWRQMTEIRYKYGNKFKKKQN